MFLLRQLVGVNLSTVHCEIDNKSAESGMHWYDHAKYVLLIIYIYTQYIYIYCINTIYTYIIYIYIYIYYIYTVSENFLDRIGINKYINIYIYV